MTLLLLFLAGWALGLLVGLLARRAGSQSQPQYTSTKDIPTTGGYGVRPKYPAKPYPPRPTPRAPRYDQIGGYQPNVPPADWTRVVPPTTSGVQPPKERR